jgi:uncharacterized protein YbcI
MARSRGQLEAEISDAIVRFELDYMGRGPEEARTYLIDDLVLVRLRGVLTPAERQLAGVDGTPHGRELVKQIRGELIEKARPLLEAIVTDITGQAVRSLHTDISTLQGERIIVFSLAGPVRLPTE